MLGQNSRHRNGILVSLSLVLTVVTNSFWQLYFTYSMLLAAGTGGGFSLVLASVSRWFVRRRGLALGVALSGEGAGTLAVAPLAAFLISSFDWRTAYSIIGLIAGMTMIGMALFLKKVPRNHELDGARSSAVNGNGQERNFSLNRALKTGNFWFLGSVYLLFSLSFHLVLTHVVPHATDLGVTATRASLIISLIGGSTIPGRLIIGWASDRFSRKMLAIYCALFQVAAMLWLTWSSSLWMFYVFAACFGFAFGGLSNLMATLIGDIFGLTNLGTITGTLVVGFSIGAAIGPAWEVLCLMPPIALISFLVGAGAFFDGRCVPGIDRKRQEKEH
jgi:predicted MFS family arabinose efflux permease